MAYPFSAGRGKPYKGPQLHFTVCPAIFYSGGFPHQEHNPSIRYLLNSGLCLELWRQIWTPCDFSLASPLIRRGSPLPFSSPEGFARATHNIIILEGLTL